MCASCFKESRVHLEKWDFKDIFREEKGNFSSARRERDVTEANESS